MNNKKGIGAVVATALLLVVAVVAVVGFQGWFQTFQSTFIADVETQSQTSMFGSGIETIVGEILYIKTKGNLTISKIEIDGNTCNFNGTITNMQPIDISDCIGQVSTTTPEIIVVTNDKILTKTIYSKSLGTICSGLPGEWVLVPGSSYFGISDFCVMKWEAKAYNTSSGEYIPDGGASLTSNWADLSEIQPHSVEEATAWVNVGFFYAYDACKTLGDNFNLITNRQWMTIARNIESNRHNWNSTEVGNGWIPRGYTSAALNGTDPRSGIERRTLLLSNGGEIWDMAGGRYEYVDANENGTFVSGHANICDESSFSGWFQFDACTTTSHPLYRKNNAPDTRYEIGPIGNYNSSYGIGSLHQTSIWQENIVMFRARSGQAGIYSVHLVEGGTGGNIHNGFRCTYTP